MGCGKLQRATPRAFAAVEGALLRSFPRVRRLRRAFMDRTMQRQHREET